MWRLSIRYYSGLTLRSTSDLAVTPDVDLVTLRQAWLSFSPVASYAAHYYNTSLDNINWQMTQFMIVQLIVTPFIMWAVDHWSFRWVVSVRGHWR